MINYFVANRFSVVRLLAIMYLNIHALGIADGLKDALIHVDFTIESILKHGPSKIASIMGIDPYIAGIIFNAAKKAAKPDGFVQKQNNNNFVKPLSA